MKVWFFEDNSQRQLEFKGDLRKRLGDKITESLEEICTLEESKRCFENLQDGDVVSLDSQVPDKRAGREEANAGLILGTKIIAARKRVHLLWHSDKGIDPELERLGVRRVSLDELPDVVARLFEARSEPSVVDDETAQKARLLLEKRTGQTKEWLLPLWVLVDGYVTAMEKRPDVTDLVAWFAPAKSIVSSITKADWANLVGVREHDGEAVPGAMELVRKLVTSIASDSVEDAQVRDAWEPLRQVFL
jgi:hypothetical protein